MTVRLPDELRTAVFSHPGEPVELIDDQTHSSYVLLPAEDFHRLKMAVKDDMSETYTAQFESAMRSGWDDPLMDDYNDYDSHRQQE